MSAAGSSLPHMRFSTNLLAKTVFVTRRCYNQSMRVTSQIRELADISASQWGFVTTSQAEQRGVSRMSVSRLAKAGALVKAAQGVYKDAGSPPEQFDELRAEWLALKPEVIAELRLKNLANDFIASGKTAAWLHEVGDLYPTPFEFAIQERHQTAKKTVRFVKAQVSAIEVDVVAGLPVTTITRTVTDLLRSKTDLTHIAQVIADSKVGAIDFSALERSSRAVAGLYGYKKGSEKLFEKLNAMLGVNEDAFAAQIARSTLAPKVMSDFLKIYADQLPKIPVTVANDALKEQLALLQKLSGTIPKITVEAPPGIKALQLALAANKAHFNLQNAAPANGE